MSRFHHFNRRQTASIYLLTASVSLWMRVGKYADDNGIEFDRIILSNCSVYEYTLFKAAKNLYHGKSISFGDLTDPDVVPQQLFAVICMAYELAHFVLGKEQADKLGVEGITAASREDDPSSAKKDKTETPTKPQLNDEGALLSVKSGGNQISFFPDGTFKLIAYFTQSGDGLTIDYTYTLSEKYSVKDGMLVLPENATGALNADLFAQYGKVDVETPTKCSAKIVDGLLDLRFVIQTGAGEIEVASFKIGEKDAAKLGVKGVTGDTVVEEKKEAVSTQSSGGSSGGNAAPAQPAVSSSAKPLSYSSNGYEITFYSNGQYTQSGTVYADGNPVSVTVTDTYTIDGNGNLKMSTGNQVSCYLSYGGQSLSFGATNNTS